MILNFFCMPIVQSLKIHKCPRLNNQSHYHCLTDPRNQISNNLSRQIKQNTGLNIHQIWLRNQYFCKTSVPTTTTTIELKQQLP